MKYDFHVGQLVRIGNECNKNDPNLGKRGIISKLDKLNITVEMLDPFEDGQTHITWVRNGLWEPCGESAAFYCKSLL